MYELQLMEASEAIKQIEAELIGKMSRAQLSLLLQKTPEDQIKKRLLNPSKPKSSHNPELSYLEHAYVEETLNYAFLFQWSSEVVSKERIGDEALVEVLLTITLPNGVQIKKSGFGGHRRIEKNAADSWANTFNSAYSKAIKVAASKVGIGLDLYSKQQADVLEAESRIVRKLGYEAEQTQSTDKPVLASQYKAITDLGGDPDSVSTYQQATELIRELAQKKRK